MSVLFDSDALIEVVRRREPFDSYAQALLADAPVLFVSAISYYEVLRGVEVAHAFAQQRRLLLLDSQLQVLPISKAVAERATTLYLNLRAQGLLLPDADLLIAATALAHGLALATRNQRHFSRIPSLSLANWDA